jgi:hypothetical protein
MKKNAMKTLPVLIKNILFFAVINLVFVSCVSIKPSTVELSTEVGKRIVDMQNSHQILVSRYFDLEKKKIEDFITETWEPKFLANFMKTSNVMEILKTDPKPENVIMDFADAAHVEMQKQRNLMLAPIEEAKLQSTTALNDAYAELIRGQSTITGRLEAATKRSQQQDELVGKLKLGDISTKATESLVNISTKVQNALDKAKSVDVSAVLKTLTDALK